ncbi:MAG: hypothetical protein J7L52_00045 [Thermotogae bacterium]|nr:hypothetical protein [Thermotogota bacterium]
MLGFLKGLIPLAVTLVEMPGEGEKKKLAVKEMVSDVLESFNLNIPDLALEMIVDYAIDHIVERFNSSGWKDELQTEEI